MAHRLKSHLVLIVSTVISLGGAAAIGPTPTAADRVSIVSAYLCLALLVAVLLIGPINALREGRPSANSYIRRDIGIWAALNGLVHFYLANVLSMNYEYLGIYVENATLSPSPTIRSELYSWGTTLGYIIAVLFLVLLALSNDWIVHKLGLKWWKRLQRTSYLGFLFTVLHAFAFQMLESRDMLWIGAVFFALLLVFFFQGRGLISVYKVRASRAVDSSPAEAET